jgi:hypothetical protein
MSQDRFIVTALRTNGLQENETLLLVNNSSDPMISLHRDPDHNPGLCIEKLLNERFELKKSGIAELKLLPLKDRLTRCALLSSRP